MVEHGARNLILTSRSASTRGEVDAYLCDLQKTGCKVAVYDCDISNAEDLARFLKCEQEMVPIRGVVQAAMVLKACDFLSKAMTLFDVGD